MKINLLFVSLAFAISEITLAEGVTTQQTPASEEISFYQSTINKLNQSPDAQEQIALSDNWTKYLSISGGVYVDAKAGDFSYDTQGENTNRLSMTNAHLTINAIPNSWTHMTVVTNYSGASDSYVPNPDNELTTDNSLYLDQAYVTFGDDSRYPVFAQIGKQYLPFGQYNVYPVIKSLGQVLTQTNATDAQVGFVVPEGLYGSAYVFQNPVNEDGSEDTGPYNAGLVLGVKKNQENLVFDAGIGYMNNISGVDAIANYLQQGEPDQGYGNTVSALAPYFSFQTGPFGIDLGYVAALSAFDKATLPYELDSDEGAKLSAIDMQASYAFNRHNINHVLMIGYQISEQASALNIPRKRYMTAYNIYPLENVMLGFEVTRDTNYDGNVTGDTVDGEEYFTYNMRLGVQF